MCPGIQVMTFKHCLDVFVLASRSLFMCRTQTQYKQLQQMLTNHLFSSSYYCCVEKQLNSLKYNVSNLYLNPNSNPKQLHTHLNLDTLGHKKIDVLTPRSISGTGSCWTTRLSLKCTLVRLGQNCDVAWWLWWCASVLCGETRV